MIKKSCILLFVLGFGASFIAHAQDQEKPTNCEDVQYGTFILEDKKTNYKARITRKDSIQIEYDMVKNLSSTYRVTWLDPCTYTLQIIETEQDFPPEFNDIIMAVAIRSIKSDTVYFDIGSVEFGVSSFYMIKTQE